MRRPSWSRHKLLFKSPQFHEGLNLTVRKGGKWFEAANPGDELAIVDTADEDKVILRGEVVLSTYGRLNEIPEAWLKYEHDPSCRDQEGLYAEMQRVYLGTEQADFVDGKNLLVSCILFTVPKAWPPVKTESDLMNEALDRPAPVR